MKKVVLIIICLFIVTGCKLNNKSEGLNIVVTNFPSYDFVRAITKGVDNVKLDLLVKPGSELHDYEPTPQDIIKIGNSDLFIYVGGDSDSWIDDVLNSIDTNKVNIIKLMDLVDTTLEGKSIEDTNEIEDDEHVWTSPYNAIEIINKVRDSIVKIDSRNSELYNKNTNDYIDKINNVIDDINEIINNSKRKELVFGDRFPLIYFTNDFNLEYTAAFPGCSHQTEASSKTIAKLIDKVKNDKIPVILKLELSSNNIAETIAEATNAKVLEFHSIHNVTKNDFDSGVTYIDLMQRNIKVLKEALI